MYRIVEVTCYGPCWASCSCAVRRPTASFGHILFPVLAMQPGGGGQFLRKGKHDFKTDNVQVYRQSSSRIPALKLCLFHRLDSTALIAALKNVTKYIATTNRLILFLCLSLCLSGLIPLPPSLCGHVIASSLRSSAPFLCPVPVSRRLSAIDLSVSGWMSFWRLSGLM